MCSRYATDRYGRLVVEVTTPTIVELAVGWRGLVVGKDLPCNQVGFAWLGKAGRPPTARDRAEARPPYDSTCRWLKATPVPVDDDELDDEQAIEFARLEQQRQPP